MLFFLIYWMLKHLNIVFYLKKNTTFSCTYVLMTEKRFLIICKLNAFVNTKLATDHHVSSNILISLYVSWGRQKFKYADFDLCCRTHNKIPVLLPLSHLAFGVKMRKPGVYQTSPTQWQFVVALSLSICLCEWGRAAGSGEATHTLLERNDHLSPGDSRG